MAAAAGAFAGVTVASAKVGIGFEQGMANIRSVTRATDADMRRLEGRARSLGATTSFSATESSKAMLVLAQSGLNVEESFKSAEGVLKLAGSIMGDMAGSAELTTAAMAAFNLEADATPRIVNAITRSTQTSKLNVERLRAGFGDTASAFGQFGGTLEEGLASMGALVDVWGDGSRAGNALKGIILELTTNAGKYAEMIPRGTFETQGMVGVLEALEKRGVRADKIMGLLGKRAGPGMGLLMRIGSEGLREMTNELTNTNAAWEAYEVQQDTTRGAIDRVFSALGELGIAFFQNFGPQLKSFLDQSAAWMLQNEGKIVGSLVKIMDAIRTLVGWIVQAVKFFAKYRIELANFAKVAGVAIGAAWGLSKAIQFLNLVSKANPYILLATAIGLVAVGLLSLIERIGGWRVALILAQGKMREFGEFARFTFAQITSLVRFAADLIKNVWTNVASSLSDIFLEIAKGFANIWNPGALKEAAGNIRSIIATGFADAFESAGSDWISLMDEMTAEHAAAMETIKAQTAAAVRAARGDEEEKPRGGIPKTPTAGPPAIAGGPVFGPELPLGAGLQFPGPLSPEAIERLQLFPEKMKESTEQALSIWTEMTEGMNFVYDQAWMNIIRTDMTAAEKREAIFRKTGQVAWKIAGEVVKRELLGQKVVLATTKQTEAAKAIAVAKGAAIRIGHLLKEAAVALKTGVVNIWHATSSFFKAHAGIPFVGAALAAAGVAGMFVLLKKAKAQLFQEGGLVSDGPRGPDNVPAFLTRGEFVMPVEQTRMFLPILEAMRAGRPMLAAGSGIGGVTVNVEIPISEGSLFLAEDDQSVLRFADIISDTINERIQRGFRGE
jgi:TP901 family phage tail tape measure protein